jgi:hypothetical protein
MELWRFLKLLAEVRIQAVNNDGGHCQICCHTYSSSGGDNDFVDLLQKRLFKKLPQAQSSLPYSPLLNN